MILVWVRKKAQLFVFLLLSGQGLQGEAACASGQRVSSLSALHLQAAVRALHHTGVLCGGLVVLWVLDRQLLGSHRTRWKPATAVDQRSGDSRGFGLHFFICEVVILFIQDF